MQGERSGKAMRGFSAFLLHTRDVVLYYIAATTCVEVTVSTCLEIFVIKYI